MFLKFDNSARQNEIFDDIKVYLHFVNSTFNNLKENNIYSISTLRKFIHNKLTLLDNSYEGIILNTTKNRNGLWLVIRFKDNSIIRFRYNRFDGSTYYIDNTYTPIDDYYYLFQNKFSRKVANHINNLEVPNTYIVPDKYIN